MKRLKKNKHLLHVLKSANPKLRTAIVKSSDNELIKTLCDCCLNTLNGNHKINNCLKRKLIKYRGTLRSLSTRGTSLKKKRLLLAQKGGFLPLLLGSILSGVIGSLIGK